MAADHPVRPRIGRSEPPITRTLPRGHRLCAGERRGDLAAYPARWPSVADRRPHPGDRPRPALRRRRSHRGSADFLSFLFPSLRAEADVLPRGTQGKVMTQQIRQLSAGMASTAEVARHWGVSPDTAREVLRAAGAREAQESGWPRWLWDDVWRAEGLRAVSRHDWTDLRRPLMDAAALAEVDPRGRSERSWRRMLQHGRLPVVRLSTGVRRVRPRDLEARIDGL